MHHALYKTRVLRPHWFRVCWERIEYACREPNGSLKPVPTGTTREQLYCGQCRAKKCLFTGKKPQSLRARQQQEAEERAQARATYLQDKAHKRARGKTTGGKPLQQNCWNCCNLRIKLGGYVCRYEPEAEPISMHKSIHRYRENCPSFGFRLKLEIPPLDGDSAD